MSVEEPARRVASTSVLVIADDPPLRDGIRSSLRKIGVHVDFVKHGAHALEYLESRRYALVLLDGGLATEDAYDVCSRIRTHQMQARPQIVMLTSSSSRVDRLKGQLAGCDSYLVKPVEEAALQEMIARLT
jgi:twitching motility two-component system response regulator PilG